MKMKMATGVSLSTASNCSNSTAAVSPPLLHSAFAVGSVFSLPAIALNVLLIVILFQSTALHRNVRLLLGNISVSAVVFSLCFVGRGLHVFLAKHSSDPCHLEISFRSCIAADLLYSSSLCALLGSVFGVAVERFIATSYHANYERASRWIAFALISACWLQSPVGSVVLMTIIPFNEQIQFCSIVFVISRALPPVMVLIIVCNLVISIGLVPSYVSLIWLNRRKLTDFCANQAFLSLNSRLHLRHNIEVAETLLPSVVIQSVVWASLTSLIATVVFSEEISFPEKVSYFFLGSVGTIVYALLHPILCLYRMRIFRREVLYLIENCRKVPAPQRRESTTIASSVEADVIDEPDKQVATMAHFQLLDDMWSGRRSRTSSLKHKPDKDKFRQLSYSFSSLHAQVDVDPLTL